jgi:hypothetical protein
MDQMIEIMHFSVSIFAGGVSGTSSPDTAQTSSWGSSKMNHDSSRSRNSQIPLLGNPGIFQEVDVIWQLLNRSCSVRRELVWNRLKTKLFQPELLGKKSETRLFRDSEMSAQYFA